MERQGWLKITIDTQKKKAARSIEASIGCPGGISNKNLGKMIRDEFNRPGVESVRLSLRDLVIAVVHIEAGRMNLESEGCILCKQGIKHAACEQG